MSTRISSSYSGLHLTAHVLQNLVKALRLFVCEAESWKEIKVHKCAWSNSYQCVWPGSSWTGTLAFRRSHTCIPDSSSAVTYTIDSPAHRQTSDNIFINHVFAAMCVYIYIYGVKSYKYIFSFAVVINITYMGTLNWINLPVNMHT